MCSTRITKMWRCFVNQAASSHTQKGVKTNSEMLLIGVSWCRSNLRSRACRLSSQHLGGSADLIPSSVQQLSQKLDVSSFLTLGENICRHRRVFDPLERVSLRDWRCLIMLSSIPRRLSSDVFFYCGTGCEESICKALAIVHAQGFCHLEIGFVLGKIAQISEKLTIQHSKHVRVFQTGRTSHNSSYLARVPSQH